jgi:hypothetical protein
VNPLRDVRVLRTVEVVQVGYTRQVLLFLECVMLHPDCVVVREGTKEDKHDDLSR